MRNLKRALSLALASVMLLGMMVVGSSAVSYGDVDSADNVEAIDLLQAISVMSGDDKGNFNPDQVVTRAEMAVIVCNILYGKNLNVGQFVGADVFKDVPVWAQGYVNLAASLGIVAGVGDGKFAPNEPVTTAQAALMICRALGYFQTDSEFANGWMLAATERGTKIGLYENLSGLSATAGLTRDDVAQMVFNALTKATPVDYNEVFGYYTVGGTLTGGVVDGDDHNTLTLAYKTFDVTKDSKVEYGVNGYTWVSTKTNKDLTDFYATDKVLYTSTNGDAIADLTNPSNSKYQASVNGDVATTYIANGATVSTYATGAAYESGDKVVYNGTLYQATAQVTSGANTAWTAVSGSFSVYAPAKGTVVKLVDKEINDAYDGKVEVIAITEMSVAKLATAPKTETSGSVTTVTISSIPALASGKDVKLVEGYEGLAKDDVVLYYNMFNALDSKVYTIVEKTESFTGTVAAYNDTDSKVTVADTVYSISGVANAKTYANVKGELGKENYTFYLDKGGNIAYYVAPDASATVNNTLLVLATQDDTNFGEKTYQAKVLYMDGTEGTITVNKTAKFGGTLSDVVGTALNSYTGSGKNDAAIDNGELVAGYYYTYTKNSSNEYQLTAAKNQIQAVTDLTAGGGTDLNSGDTSYRIIKDTAKFLMPVTSTGSTWAGATDGTANAALANSSTLFLYYNENNKTYTVYTGISKVPSYNAGGDIYVLMDADNQYALAVVAKGAATVTAADTYDKIFVTSSETQIYDKDGNYYQYTAIVNGEIGKTVYSYQQLAAGTLYYANDYDQNGRINAGTALTTITGATTVNATSVSKIEAKGGTLTVTGTSGGSYILSDSVRIFVYDTTKSPKTVTEISAGDIEGLTVAGGNEKVTTVSVSNTDASLAYVFITIA